MWFASSFTQMLLFPFWLGFSTALLSVPCIHLTFPSLAFFLACHQHPPFLRLAQPCELFFVCLPIPKVFLLVPLLRRRPTPWQRRGGVWPAAAAAHSTPSEQIHLVM